MQKKVDEETNPEEQQYDPYKTPADLDLAKKHLKAKSIGMVRNMKAINPEDICPCCGCVIEKEKIDITADIKTLGFLGSGVSLYFFFIKYCISFLFFIGLVSSIFNIMRNNEGKTCKLLKDCDDGFVNRLSIINREDALDKFTTSAGLNFLTTITLMVASIILKKNMKYLNKVIDMDNVTPGDFTVMITNLRIGTTEQQIVEYIKSYTRGQGEIQIIKVVFAYNISHYIELKRQHQSVLLQQLKEKAILEKAAQNTSQKLSELNEQAERLEKRIEELEEHLRSGKFTTSGTAFITFGSDNTAEFVVKVFKRSFIGTLWRSLTRIGTLNGSLITVKRAPEPNDIYWENLCYSFFDRFQSKVITYFSTAALLTGCFFIIFAISKAQDNRSAEDKDDPAIIFLSFLASLCLFVINNGISMIIKRFALFEKHPTLTHYFIGVAEKSGIAQFLNTTIIVYIVKKLKWDNQIYISGGLMSTIHFILLMNFISAFNVFLNPFYFMRLWNRKKAEDGDKNYLAKTPQYKIHEVFEGPKFDFPMNYAKHVKLIMFASFYSYPAPLIVYLSIGIIFLCYWIDKYHLIRRCSVPETLSHLLPNAMVDFYLELMIVIFCVGNLTFENLLFDKVSGFTITSLVFAILYWILDFDAITDCICPINSNNFQVKRYDQYSYQFLTDYERSNPVTAMKAIEEWTKKIQDQKGTENNKQKLTILSNYALNRPGMSFFQPQGFRPMGMQPFQQQQMGGMNPYQQPGMYPGQIQQNNQFLRSQFTMGGMPGNRIQVYPQNQQLLNQDPQTLQNELNTLKTQQDILQNQLANNVNPQNSLMIINQLERNNQRINYLQVQIQQVNQNTSLKNPLLPAAPQGHFVNPLQDDRQKGQVVFNSPQQNSLANPLVINSSNQSQVNSQQNVIPVVNNAVLANPLIQPNSNPLIQPNSNPLIQPNQNPIMQPNTNFQQSPNTNPMIQPNFIGQNPQQYQLNQNLQQPQQQGYRMVSPMGNQIQQPYMQNQQQQQYSNPQQPTNVISMLNNAIGMNPNIAMPANAQFSQLQQQQGYRQGVIPMIPPMQQQPQQYGAYQQPQYNSQYQ